MRSGCTAKDLSKPIKYYQNPGKCDKNEILLAAIVTEKQIFESLKAKGVSVSYNTAGMFAKWMNGNLKAKVK